MLELLSETNAPRRILCLGAHCDDIEIGCGGTVLKLLEARDDVRVDWIVFTSDEKRASEARAGATAILGRAAESNVVVREFRQRLFPYIGAEIKEYFDELAVMVDTFRPLEIGEAGRASDDGEYAWSWAGGRR